MSLFGWLPYDAISHLLFYFLVFFYISNDHFPGNIFIDTYFSLWEMESALIPGMVLRSTLEMVILFVC